MDIEKAVNTLNHFVFCGSCTTGPCKDCDRKNAKDTAIQGLRELQQYHQIGTVERFAALESQMKPHVTDETCCPERNCNKCDKYRIELEKYHEIGTVDECRATRDELIELQEYRKLGTVKECWEAREKMKPKKPVKDNYNYYHCPNCRRLLANDDISYCGICGQTIKRED